MEIATLEISGAERYGRERKKYYGKYYIVNILQVLVHLITTN